MFFAMLNVTIEAYFVWQLLFDYNNQFGTGLISQKYTQEITTVYKSREFIRKVNEETTKLHYSHRVVAQNGASYGPISTSLGDTAEFSRDVMELLQMTTETQVDREVVKSTKLEKSYEVGPGTHMCLYQRIFVAPGIILTLDTHRVTTSGRLAADEIRQRAPIEILLRPTRYISNIKVVYGGQASDAPAERIRELHGQNDDINAGYGGSYVWLVPEYTTDTREAVNIIDFVIQGDSNPHYSDLARGAGGSWRYLIPRRVGSLGTPNAFITHFALLRSGTWATLGPETGFVGTTRDINADRGGDFLFLVWKAQTASPVDLPSL